jgi:hypothetical protein
LKQDTFAWSLTGPHIPAAAPVALRGGAATVAEAKRQLVDAMRAWAVWAGLRTPDGGPTTPRWVPEGADWHLLSGGFLAGRVRRPTNGPRHDPHWMLLGTSATECPGPRAGWGDSADAAKEDLLRAWQDGFSIWELDRRLTVPLQWTR